MELNSDQKKQVKDWFIKFKTVRGLTIDHVIHGRVQVTHIDPKRNQAWIKNDIGNCLIVPLDDLMYMIIGAVTYTFVDVPKDVDFMQYVVDYINKYK